MGAALCIQVFVYGLQHDPVSNNSSYSSAMVARSFSLFLQISFCCFLHSVQVEVPHLVCPIFPYQNSHIALSANRKICAINYD